MCCDCYQKKLLRNCPEVCDCLECVHDDYYRCIDWGWQYPKGAFENRFNKLDDFSLAFNSMTVSGTTQPVIATNMVPNPLSKYSNVSQAMQSNSDHGDHNVYTTQANSHMNNNDFMEDPSQQQPIKPSNNCPSIMQARAKMPTYTQIPTANAAIASSCTAQPMDC